MKIKITNFLVIKICFFLLLFQSLLTYIWADNILGKIVSYIDEIIEIISLIYLLVHCYSLKNMLKHYRKIAGLLFGLMIIGVISTILNRVNSLFPTIVDCLNCGKFIIIFLASIIFINKKNKMSVFLFSINRLIRMIIVLLGTLNFINVFVYPIFPVRDFRMFMYSQMLMWRHPGEYATVILICMFILIYNSKIYNNILYMIIGSLCIVSTMRVRILAALVIMWALYIYFIKLRIKSKIFLYLCVLLALVLVGYNQFSYYYSNTDQTRYIVTYNSLRLANEEFPFGTGFASYGTNMARQYYSPLYLQLGYDSIWGLNQENDEFLSDQFWPAVLSQFGWIGTLLFILLLYEIYQLIKRTAQKDIYGYTAALLIFIYEIIAAFGEMAYFSPIAVIVFIILALCIDSDIEYQNRYLSKK